MAIPKMIRRWLVQDFSPETYEYTGLLGSFGSRALAEKFCDENGYDYDDTYESNIEISEVVTGGTLT